MAFFPRKAGRNIVANYDCRNRNLLNIQKKLLTI